MVKRYFNSPVWLLLSLGVFWGSGYSIARYVVTHGVSSMGYSFWQSIGPAVLLSLIYLAQARRKSRPPVLSNIAKRLKYFFLCGLIGIAIPNTLMYYAAAHLPSSILAVLINTAPLVIYPIALVSRQESFQPLRLFALALGCIGIFMIVTHVEALPGGDTFRWALLVLLTPICFATCVSFINPLKPKDMSPLAAASGMLLTSSIILLPFLIGLHAFYPLSGNVLSLLIALEIVLSSLGYVIFFRLIYLAGPVYYSLVGGVIGVTGIFWGMTIFKDPWSLIDTLGTALIILAIYTLNRKCITSPS